MPTPRDNPVVLEEWKKYAERRFSEDDCPSMEQVAKELAKRFEVHPGTVRRYLDAHHNERVKVSNRLSAKRRYDRLKKKREYERQYRRVTRHPERYIVNASVSCRRPWVTIDEIAAELQIACAGIAFKPQTVARIIQKYLANRGSDCLCEIARGIGYFDQQVTGDNKD